MAEFSLQINIGSIKIGSISNASSFNIGRNNLRDFDNMSKRNQGSGDVLGDNNSFPSNTSTSKTLTRWICGQAEGVRRLRRRRKEKWRRG